MAKKRHPLSILGPIDTPFKVVVFSICCIILLSMLLFPSKWQAGVNRFMNSAFDVNEQSDDEVLASDTSTTITTTESTIVVGSNTQKKDYQIIHEIEGYRADNGANIYVLLPTLDYSSDSFISTIQDMINDIVTEKGNTISIDFFDDLDSLEIQYKLYGTLTLGRNTTEEENSKIAQHYIAGYSGNLTTDLYLNTLYVFPAANSDTPNVGKHVSIQEYNPSINAD